MAQRTPCLLSAVAVVITLTGCAAVRQQLSAALVPVATEIELGQEMAAQIDAEEKVLPDTTLPDWRPSSPS